MSALTNLGNNSGYIYVTDTDGTSIIENIPNNLNNVKKMLVDASTSVGLSGRAGIYDSNYGRRYFLDTSGVVGVLSGSEITQFVISRGLESTLPVTSYTIASGVLTPLRYAAITVVNIDTEGAAASDDLDTITTTDYNTGDIIIFRGTSAARIVTFKTGTGNMTLSNATNYATGNKINSIILQYVSGSGWFEISRSPNPLISVANMRAAGIPEPIAGVDATALTNGGGTINLEPGVDKGIQVYTGTITMAASWTIQIQAVPATAYLDGDTMIVEYRALATTGVNTVTIFGIALTTTQALEGRVVVMAKYKLSNTTWYYDIFYDARGVDVTNKAYVDATFEDALGNPAGNGYILSSNIAGVRSWIPNPAGSNLWEVGSGLNSIQTLGNGADASGQDSIAAGGIAIASDARAIALGYDSNADGIAAIAIGLGTRASAQTSMAIGQSSETTAVDAIALGLDASANGQDSIALGAGSRTNVDYTTNISGALITKRAASVLTGNYFLEGASSIITLTTAEIDLEGTNTASITIWPGCTFYCDSVELIISTAGGTATVAPTIKVGTTGTLDLLVPVVLTTVVAARNRDKFESVYDNGITATNLVATVTVAATTATTLLGRFVYKGILVEDE